jgi:hypothetical protein
VHQSKLRFVASGDGGADVRLRPIEASHKRTAQHWVFDEVTKTIKNRQHNSRSLSISGNYIRLQPTNSRWFQLFENNDGYLTNTKGKVIEVASTGAKPDFRKAQARLAAADKNGQEHQQWEVVYVDAMAAEPKKGELNKDFGLYVDRPFFVVSTLKEERYVDTVSEGGAENLRIKVSNGRTSQLWWFDQGSKSIRSMARRSNSWSIRNRVVDGNAPMESRGFANNWYNFFAYDETKGVFYSLEDNNRCVGVEGAKDEEGTNLQIGACNGSAAQKWKLIYQDKAEKTRTEGLNKDFGIEINRPFFLVTKMDSERIVECQGASALRLKRAAPLRNNLAQHFFFDEVSKTIKSQQWKDRSLTIQNNGRSNNLYMSPTNSRWFQLFEYKDNKIVNERGKAMMVQGSQDRENANIVVHGDLGAAKTSQLFDLIYVDEMPKEP